MKITYYVQRYRPKFEAISKEVELLVKHFSLQHQVKIHDLHLDGIFKMSSSPGKISYHFAYYPLFSFYTYFLSKNSDINHIYTSLGDLPYLSVLSLKNTVLTAAASCNFTKVLKRKRQLMHVKKIIVQAEKQRQMLLSMGIPSEKIELLPSFIDLTSFSYTKADGPFTVLYASCPTRPEDFKKRGIFLLLETAKAMPEVRFHLAWRGGAYEKINKLISEQGITNIIVENKIVAHPWELYAEKHCTIIPYLEYDDYLKLIPNSAIESLAAGKPLLMTAKTEMTELVQREKCGLIFESTSLDLQASIKKLQKNYFFYQKNCRKTAEANFSEEFVLKGYEKIYRGGSDT